MYTLGSNNRGPESNKVVGEDWPMRLSSDPHAGTYRCTHMHTNFKSGGGVGGVRERGMLGKHKMKTGSGTQLPPNGAQRRGSLATT